MKTLPHLDEDIYWAYQKVVGLYNIKEFKLLIIVSPEFFRQMIHDAPYYEMSITLANERTYWGHTVKIDYEMEDDYKFWLDVEEMIW